MSRPLNPTVCPYCRYQNGGRFIVCPICKAPIAQLKRFERFVERVPIAGCWLWTGCVRDGGYGRTSAGPWQTAHSKTINAHRLAWLLYRGPIPAGLHVCHRCDVPSCVNPDHLFLGTPADNHRDCIAKGRARRGRLRGERHGRAKLTEDQARLIRDSDEPLSILARRFGVAHGTVHSIKMRRNWKHIS